MAVRADKRLARYTEAFKVYLMADAVARTRKTNASLLAHALDEAVVVGVLKTRLKGVMVDVCDGEFRLYSVYSHRLKFKVCHGTRGILGEGLVNADSNLVSGDHFTADKVFLNDFLTQCLSQCSVRSFNKLECFFNKLR